MEYPALCAKSDLTLFSSYASCISATECVPPAYVCAVLQPYIPISWKPV